MPTFWTPQGQIARFEQATLLVYRCDKCASRKLRPIAFVRGKDHSAFLFECVDCYEHVTFIFAKRQLTSPDIIVNIVENVGELNKQIEQEPSHGQCPKCFFGKYHSIDIVKSNRMALDIVECGNCRFSVPIISIVRSTLFAYSHDIQLAKRVVKDYPEIALVFCISALETYFRQLFQYHSEANASLVKRRLVNFQNLRDSRMLLKKEFGIDIRELIKSNWDFLHKSFRKRHFIIHNASFDLAGKRIQVSEEEISRLMSVVDDLVYKMEMALFNKNLAI
jgi:Zn finger protein HypA/HybF involved in hydrogenase expression